MSDTKSARRADVAALVALALATLTFFWKIALTNRVLAGLDLFAYFYPYRDFASEALRAGRLPLWNPYLFMGAPLLANSQAAVLYPLHWPLLWLSAPKQIAWSIVLHVWLAGAGTYLFSRRVVRLRLPAALVAASVFALGGFLGAQVEHVNQFNASAWLPWLLLCLEGALDQGRRRWPALLGGGAVVGLLLLAGHTQAAYIVLFGAAVYAMARRASLKLTLRGIGALAVMGLAGVLLAAGQLLPTLELSRLSVRGSGLPYNEAASFSLKPGLIFKAFLPPLLWEPPFSEYVAYVGLIGLALAAVGAWAVVRRRRQGWPFVILALVGVFLAFGAYNPVYYLFYKLVPGFDLFRAPARWLLLYGFGAAILAGVGLEVVAKRFRAKGKWAAPLIVLLLMIELFLAGRKLAYNQPTAPTAFDSMRSAPAHLLADPSSAPFRFLSMSDILYDPGDLGDLQAMYGDQLPEEAVYDLLVATKMKEVLAYNLPLRYRLYSVDGYDGGLLPIARYVTLERLFLAEEDIWSDGRLRQQLDRVPPSRLLSLLNVKYVITDKMQDAWLDGVFYDLEHTVPLGQVTLGREHVPEFEATHLGVVYDLAPGAELAGGTAIAQITLTDAQGNQHTATLLAGSGDVAMLDLGGALRPQSIQVASLLPGESIYLRGLTLVDRNTGTSRTVSVEPAYRQVHSGDVKIYENLEVLPRAFVVHNAVLVPDDEAALAALRDPGFDPARQVILAAGQEMAANDPAQSQAEIIAYEPEQVQIRASLDTPGYLVLTDTWYPGWRAEVDGQPVPIRRADIYFRAVALEAGEHELVFRYEPTSTYAGLVVGLLGWLAWGVVFAVSLGRIGRKRPSGV